MTYSDGIGAPIGITNGPDGNVWFTELLGNRIGRMTPGGTVTEFAAGLTAAALPFNICTGPDGNLWFTENAASQIGRITPAGVITEFPLAAGRAPDEICLGPDGNLWFAELDGDRIGRIPAFGFVFRRIENPAAIRARGGRLSIHVCGKTTHVIGRLAETGAHIVEFDALTDFDTAWQAAQGKTCLLGNVDVPAVITFGTEQQVVEECRWRLEKVRQANGGFILSSGCAISPNAPAANLRAMVASAQEYG